MLGRKAALTIFVLVWIGGFYYLITTPDPVPPAKGLTYCPHPANPPEKVAGLPPIVEIDAFSRGVLMALDRGGQLWMSYRGEVCEPASTRKITPPHVFGLHAPRLHRLTSIWSGSGHAGFASTPAGHLVLWSPDGFGSFTFEGYPRVSPSCDEASENCIVDGAPGLNDVEMVSRGGAHTLFLRSNGEAWSAGRNDCGQLGRTGVDSPPGYLRPGPIDALGGVAAVAAGYKNSLALKPDGTVWEWGNTTNAYLASESGKPTGDFPYCHAGSFSQGEFEFDNAADSEPAPVAGLSDVVAISAFYAFNLALKGDGTVWGWGQNRCGQLGTAPNYEGLTNLHSFTPVRIHGLPPIQAIVAGKRHALALDREGNVWGWGYNDRTELGSKAATPNASLACGVDNSVLKNALFSATPLRVPGIPRVKAITAGYNFSAALDEHGEVWVWGPH